MPMSAEVHGDGGATEQALAEDLRERRGHALHRLDLEAGVAQKVPDRPEGEEPRVRAIEDAGLAVVELTAEEHEPLHEERDVGRGQDERLGVVLELLSQLVEEALGVAQVLDHVEHQQVLVLPRVELRRVLEVLRDHLDVDDRHRGRVPVDDGHVTALVAQLARQAARPGADVEHLATRRHRVERVRVAARVAELEVVVRVVDATAARSAAGRAGPSGAATFCTVAQQDVLGVLHPVHAADLVAVVRGNRQLAMRAPALSSWMMISVSKWKSFELRRNGMRSSVFTE